MNMLSSNTSFDSSQPQMNEITANSTRPMSPFQIKTSYVGGGNQQRAATVADQQAAAAAAPLKCPRCDSANTKFCYYNNYSLSQPRHFCKACKRYWTRGGTLRNVPVGGGCRKIKQRVRQPTTKPLSGHRISSNSHDYAPDPTAARRHAGRMEEPDSGLNDFLHGNNTQIFNGFGSSRVTNQDPSGRANSSSGYNQIHNLGLGFSPAEYMRNQSTDSSYLSSYSTLFGSSFSSPSGISSASPLMRSVLGSGFDQYDEKFVNEPSSLNKGHMGSFLSVLAAEDMQIGGSGGGFGTGIKVEELGQMKINQMGNLSTLSMDPSVYNWNNGASSIINSWPDVLNIGSSVMPLL